MTPVWYRFRAALYSVSGSRLDDDGADDFDGDGDDVAASGFDDDDAAGGAGEDLDEVIAENIGVVPAPRIPVLTLAAVALAALLVANAVASWPALMAARTRPASALRSE